MMIRGKEMKISSVNLDQPFCKEFSTVFENPIIKGQEDRSYTLEYDVEEPERFYENAFQVYCKEFTLKFIFKNDSKIKDVQLFEINQETEQKSKSSDMPQIEKNDQTTTYTWFLKDLVKGRTIHLTW